MRPLGQFLKSKAISGCIMCQQLVVDKKPFETFAIVLIVAHFVNHLAIVSIVKVHEHAAIVIEKEIAQVGGIEQYLPAGFEQALSYAEKLSQTIRLSYDASAIHKHKDGIKFLGGCKLEEVVVHHLSHATAFHYLTSQWRQLE